MARSTVKLDYKPFPEQRAFHLSTKRIRVAVTGARAGKTLCAGHDFFDKCMLQPGYKHIDVLNNKPYTVVAAAPTYKTLERVTVPTVMRIIPKEVRISKYHQTKRQLLVQGVKGVTCIYFTNASDPESWQGQELYGVWIDEFALIKENMFNEAETRVSTLNGWIILTGTLRRGPGWAQHRIKEYSETVEGKEVIELFQWPTLANPYTNREHILHMKSTLPPRYFSRMFEASWDSFEGQVYDNFVKDKHVVNPAAYTMVYPNWRKSGNGAINLKFVRVVAGVDWGHANPGVIVICGKTAEGSWYVLDEVYEMGLLIAHEQPSQDTWLRRARQLKAEWAIDTFWCDPSEPGNIEAFCKAGLPAKPAINNVASGIMSVAQLLQVDEMTREPKLYFMNTVAHTIEEVTYYQWAEQVGGTYKESPVKERDHACDALRYCLHSDIRRGTFKSEPGYQP